VQRRRAGDRQAAACSGRHQRPVSQAAHLFSPLFSFAFKFSRWLDASDSEVQDQFPDSVLFQLLADLILYQRLAVYQLALSHICISYWQCNTILTISLMISCNLDEEQEECHWQ
jgi:hypothetical protein